ncbi:uncharacterized protein B0H18DRAFT_968149 [Fomitopsis serialis]|uniref:uncharacterized protein n=1 Tax=Fomitopsis serialis TaxID=139415 RepID=UPI0020084E98|nr:uncharacterized protein B0H18DRAFT_968149 [Neoantrodia serialis]KAH9938643.1 hypothetical protein B0H18DRAFT_968149 [Neoantrodia serialis]
MSDHLRQSSVRGLPGSPGRPSPLSRPHWPWSTYTHRSASSSTSVFSSSGSNSGGQGWESSSSVSTPTVLVSTPAGGRRNSTLSGLSYQAQMPEELSTRQWSFTAFEWVVRDVHRLRDFVESPDASDDVAGEAEEGEGTSPDADDFEVLKEAPIIGDGKFKLEIAKIPAPDTTDLATSSGLRSHLPVLSLYVTSLMVDNTDYEMSTSMFAAIKCQDDRAGERGARADWAWEYWHNGWVFRQESEVWECPLPPLSSLLENPRIRETDSFVICVQMHTPAGPFFPQQPSAYYVPRDLLEGLEASLDNPNTGDVQFVCLERRDAQEAIAEQEPPTPSTAGSSSHTSSASHTAGPQTIARKRIIWAHADILIRRSEYFATMLGSSFLENSSAVLHPGERKIYSVVVEEADFVTIYWLLKFVYANWLLFRKEDDPREAVDGIGAGWSARGVSTPGSPDEWEWKTFSKGSPPEFAGVSDARSVTSAESARSNGGKSVSPQSKDKRLFDSRQSSGPVPTTPSRSTAATKTSATSSRSPATQPRRSGTSSTPGGPNTLTVSPSAPAAPSSRGAKAVPVPISPSGGTFVTPPHYPISPRQQRQRSHPPAASTPDPHPHPTPSPPPASALSMYQVAHRYGMPGLASLAMEHIMSTVTPQSSFPVLLATSAWDELHSFVEDYVVDKWEEVSVSEEFERCCEEVAGGEWGPEGGKTLMALFRRLRSPVVNVTA